MEWKRREDKIERIRKEKRREEKRTIVSRSMI